jgi:thiosulfate dehydrogenase [quinone] large subunit
MSRRDRLRAQREATIRDRSRRPRDQSLRRDRFDVEPPDPARELDRLTLAMLPLRAFLGATFVYAGLDKILDPAFLQATGPGSIGAQLDGFVRVSPIGPLVQLFGQPFPVAIGLLIAVAEIAVGLGALSGLLFRLAAAGGLALSVLFWLTASWAIKPYYYGPDLPYALGWLTLALAGTGGRFTIETWLNREFDGGGIDEPISPERRLVLKAGILGLAAVAMAGLAGTVGASVLGRQRGRSDRCAISVDHRHPGFRHAGLVDRAESGRDSGAGVRAGRGPRQPARHGQVSLIRRPHHRRPRRRHQVARRQVRGVRHRMHARRMHRRIRPQLGIPHLPLPWRRLRSRQCGRRHRRPDRPAARVAADPRRCRQRPDHADRVARSATRAGRILRTCASPSPPITPAQP